MVATVKGHGAGGNQGGGAQAPQGIASGSDELESFDLPGIEAQAQECQAMNLITLREVFAARKTLTRKEARGAGLVFRGVSGQLRALEFASRD